MKYLIIPFVILFGLLSYLGLRSVHKSSLTTALDRSSSTGRVTGQIHYRGYGQPFVYLEIAEYREDITENPQQNDITAVRNAGKEMMADYNSSGRRWHIGFLLLNLFIYLTVSSGVVWIISVSWPRKS